MHAKFIVVGNSIDKHTYDRAEAKFPFDKIEVYSVARQMTLQNIADLLQQSYDAGRRHVRQEIKHIVDEIK